MSVLPGPYTRAGILLYVLPLYAGPLLAGLTAAPLRELAVFAACFALVALSGRRLDLSGAPGWAGLAVLLAVQLLLVTILYGIGLLLARLIGPSSLPPWLPLLLTLCAAAFASVRYRHSAEMDTLLDDALASLEGQGILPEDPENPLTAELDALQDAPATPETVEPALQRLLALDTPDAVYLSLLSELGEGSAAIDLAAVTLLRDPRVQSLLAGDDRLGLGLELGLMGTPDLRAAAARTARILIEANAGPAAFPAPEALEALAQTDPGNAALVEEISAHLARFS